MTSPSPALRGEAILDVQPPPADHRVAYGADPSQFGDLRLPSGPGPHPLAVAFHGGFWRERYDLEHLGHLCAALRAAGVATWNVEYRRLGQAGGGYPGTLEDVARAGAFVAALARQHPLDLTRVAAVGHSAGGQLALWWGANAAVRLRGVVALAPISDLAQGSALRLGQGVIDDFLGGAGGAREAALQAASPRALLPLRIRQIVIHGAHDDTVPVSMSAAYVTAARAAGDDAELVACPDAAHFELIDPAQPEGQTAIRRVRDLLGGAKA